ncbi:MAG TPA: DUF6714 family protein [Myxococcaceae bacterium]|nr:DUF6714 family protein [Myxococcaceae bacterium]
MSLILLQEPNVDPTKCKEMLEKAFANRPYPGDDNIGREGDDDGQDVANYFKGKDWRQINLETLLREYQGDSHAAFAVMTPEGARYYLPAFLLMALERDSEIDDSLMFFLTAPDPNDPERGGWFDWVRRRAEGLSADERAAVIYTLRCLAERYDRQSLPGYPRNPARKALESYWDRLDPSHPTMS